jgi:hypothetical protein
MALQDVQNSFVGLMNNRLLTANTSLQTQFLNQGLQRIQRELRGPINEKSILATIGTSYNGLNIPGDYLELIRLEPIPLIPDYRPRELYRTSVPRAKASALVQAAPMEVFARQGGKWWIGGPPQPGDQVRIDYYADFAPVSAPTDTNILTDAAPNLWIFAALCEAGLYYNDKRTADWETEYTQIRDALNEQADEDELSSDAQVLPAYTIPDEMFPY